MFFVTYYAISNLIKSIIQMQPPTIDLYLEEVIIGVYVCDCLIIRKEERIESLIDELKNHEFYLKIEKMLMNNLVTV
jgi:hypothetical protein